MSCGSTLVAASPHDVETDAMLVFAAQAGDADAFSELFRRHYPTVRRACARKLRDIPEADEVAQAAFVRAYERLDRCTGERRFGAWVQVIANNLCVDHVRATARTSPTDDVIGESTLVENPPEDALLRAEQAAMIQRALASLPDRQRDVVVARDVDGRRPPEIAAALGLSLGAVDSLLLRARRRLAASVQSMTAESGAANVATTTAVTAIGGGASHFTTLARFAESVTDAIAAASYHFAASMGMVPGVPSVISQAAPAAAAGAIALAPFGAGPAPAVPAAAVPPLTVTVAAVPAAPAPGSLTSSQPNVASAGAAPSLDLTATTVTPPESTRAGLSPGADAAIPDDQGAVDATLDSVSLLVDIATGTLR